MSDVTGLLSKLTTKESSVKSLRATVSAYMEDGRVNLAYGTARLYGVPCLASYTSRRVGDVVQVMDLGNNIWVVLGRIGGTDPQFPLPTKQNTSYWLYYTDNLALRGTSDLGFEGYTGVTGASGDRPVLLAWSYYSGSTNSLTTTAAGKTSVTVTVARASTLHGQREAVEMELLPHNYNALPTSLTLATGFSQVLFRLEVGEIRNLTLPADWVTGITATTPTIKGFAVQSVTNTPWKASYAIFSPTSGGFRVA